jgi:hypothetical protein
MTLAIKCRELLTKAKKLNRKALTIRESRNQVSGKAPNAEILSLYYAWNLCYKLVNMWKFEYKILIDY